MLSLDSLKSAGADTAEGMARCLNNEAFYLRMVRMALEDNKGIDALKAAVESGDKKAGFEAAHGLKGVLANLALTSYLKPVSEVTELYRASADADYAAYLNEILAEREKFTSLL